MDILEKLNKIKNIIDNYKSKSDQINPEDVKQIEDYYKWPDGTIFTKKMLTDFKMWKSFENDYSINKIGIIKLREILGAPNGFKEKYIN